MNKKLKIPEPKSFLGSLDVLNLIKLHFEVVSKLFRLIFQFIKKYQNNSYQIALYLNMNRLIKAEMDLNEAMREAQILLKLVNFLRFQNAAYTVYAGKKLSLIHI